MRLRSSEKKGLVTLFTLLACLFIVPSLFMQQKQPFFLLPEIPADTTEIQTSDTLPHPKSIVKLELNSADSIQLLKIRGIGPYYASRILRYREQLGGFYKIEQLDELHLQYLDVDSIRRFFTVNPNKIIKKELDTMSFKSVLRHPYLEYEDVVLIFQARRKWGEINHALLKEKKVLTPYKLGKIKPYFK